MKDAILSAITFALVMESGRTYTLPSNYGQRLHQLYAKQELRDMNVWVKTVDDGIETKGVDINTFAGGLRGVVAVDAISNESVVMSVPGSTALEITNTRPPTPFPQLIGQELWEKCMWDQRLAFKLLAELKGVVPAPKSTWLQHLPRSFSTPIHWDDELLEQAQYKALQLKVAEQKKTWSTLYKDWVSSGSECKSKIALDDLIYALECVNSRAFSGTFEGSTPGERRALLLFTSVLTLLWPVLGFGSTDQALAAAATVAISLIAKDFFFSRFANLKRYVLCPCVDMFNHNSSCKSDVSYNYFLDRFEVKTQQYAKGDQVFISYGKQSNDRFLQYYGFVEEMNPNDVYDFGVGFLELMLDRGDSLAEVVEFPQQPPPPTRLEAIAVAMRATMVEDSNKVGQYSIGSDKFSSKVFRRSSPVAGTSVGGKTGKGIAAQFDDFTVRAMRAFLCTPQEWASLTKGGLSFDGAAISTPLSEETENKVVAALNEVVREEVQSKPTTLEEDIQLLNKLSSQRPQSSSSTSSSSSSSPSPPTKSKGFKTATPSGSSTSTSDRPSAADADPSGLFRDGLLAAVAFRVEKKKLLLEALGAGDG